MMKFKNKKMIGKLIFVLLFSIMLASSVLAVSKPIGGQLMIDPGEVYDINVYVQVSLDENNNALCVTSPTVSNENDGSFATSLSNLVFNDFQSVDCSSFWSSRDMIWYEASIGGNVYTSEIEEIDAGTTTQILKDLIISSSSSSSSGDSNTADTSSTETSDSSPTQTSSSIVSTNGAGSSSYGDVEDENLLGVNLTLIPDGEDILAVVGIDSVENLDLGLDLMVFSLPNGNTVKSVDDIFSVTSIKSLEKQYLLSMQDFEDGWFEVQVFVYVDNTLQAVSNEEQFFVRGSTFQESVPGQTVEIVYQQPDSNLGNIIQIILLVVVILLLIKLLYDIKKKKGIGGNDKKKAKL